MAVSKHIEGPFFKVVDFSPVAKLIAVIPLDFVFTPVGGLTRSILSPASKGNQSSLA